MEPLTTLAETVTALTRSIRELHGQVSVQGVLIGALLGAATPETLATADEALRAIEAGPPSATAKAAAAARGALRGFAAAAANSARNPPTAV